MRGVTAEWLKTPRLLARLVVNVDPSRTNLQDFQRAALYPSCRLVRSMTATMRRLASRSGPKWSCCRLSRIFGQNPD